MNKLIISCAVLIAACCAAPAQIEKEKFGESNSEITNIPINYREKRCEKHRHGGSEKTVQESVETPKEKNDFQIHQSEIEPKMKTFPSLHSKMDHIEEKLIEDDHTNQHGNGKQENLNQGHQHDKNEPDHLHDHMEYSEDTNKNKESTTDSSSSSADHSMFRHKPVPVSELFSRPKVTQ